MGPWKSSAEYYSDLAAHALQVCAREAAEYVQEIASFTIPIFFQHFILSPINDRPDEPFILTNRDFGAHNILRNDDFEIIGVIDFDGVMAAPIEMVGKFLVLTGLEREAPGHVETRPLALARIERTKLKLQEYQALIKDAEANITSAPKGPAGFADLMTTDRASILQGLLAYSSHQGFVNDMWMKAFTRLLRTHIQS